MGAGGWLVKRGAREEKPGNGGLGPAARVAVLPQGPLTIPYLQNGKS